jgi:hypothetical protein
MVKLRNVVNEGQVEANSGLKSRFVSSPFLAVKLLAAVPGSRSRRTLLEASLNRWNGSLSLSRLWAF